MSNNCQFDRFGVMLDQSRNAVMKVDSVKRYIDILSSIDANFLMLYTEDTYEVKNQPYFGHNRGRYSMDELKELDSYAKEKGIELIPCIQTLAHMISIFRWYLYHDIIDMHDVLLCEDEHTYQLLEDMFATLAECFTSRTINIGLDEAHALGTGKYRDLHGHKEKIDIFLTHLNKVSEIAKKYGFKMLMWSDMFFKFVSDEALEDEKRIQEIRSMIPDNVELVYWDYYSHDPQTYDSKMVKHKAIVDNLWYAGTLFSSTGFTPHNGFSMKANEAAYTACKDNGVKNAVLCLWGDNGSETSKFATLPSLYYCSQIAHGNKDMENIKSGFKAKFGIDFDDYMLLDLPDTPNKDSYVDSEKYFLYNDPFMGLLDSLVKDEHIEQFRTAAEKLENIPNKGEFATVFESTAKLCRVVEAKCDLGVRTRKAYESKDMDALKALLDDYDEVIRRVEEFYDAFEKHWMWENKPHGFDVSDIRLGGLVTRIKHCRKRLLKYINGEISQIDELHEPLLDVICRGEDEEKTMPVYRNWERIVSTNKLTYI